MRFYGATRFFDGDVVHDPYDVSVDDDHDPSHPTLLRSLSSDGIDDSEDAADETDPSPKWEPDAEDDAPPSFTDCLAVLWQPGAKLMTRAVLQAGGVGQVWRQSQRRGAATLQALDGVVRVVGSKVFLGVNTPPIMAFNDAFFSLEGQWQESSRQASADSLKALSDSVHSAIQTWGTLLSKPASAQPYAQIKFQGPHLSALDASLKEGVGVVPDPLTKGANVLE